MLELALVNRTCRLPAFDPPQILFDRQGEQKAVEFIVIKTALKVGKLPFTPSDMLDDEVPVTETPVMMYERLECRVQMFERVFRWRVNRNQLIAAEHCGRVDAFGERLSERGFSNPERAI